MQRSSAAPPPRKWMALIRSWIFPLLLLAFVWLLLTHLAELEELAHTFAAGQLRWIVSAALVQAIFLLTFAATFSTAFQAAGVAMPLRGMIPLVFVATFVNTTAPTNGAAGAALMIEDARRRGFPTARATMGIILQMVADFAAFFLFLLVGLFFLFRYRQLQWYEVLAAGVLLIFIGGLATLLFLGLWQPTTLRRIMGSVQFWVNRLARLLRRPAWLGATWGLRNANELIATSRTIVERPRWFLLTALLSFVAHVFDTTTLYFLFLAFNYDVPFGVLIAGYAMAILFSIVSPTANGVGVVEGMLPVVLTSMGVPPATATVVALAFRGMSFWLPFFIGFILLRQLPIFRPHEATMAETGQVKLIALLTSLMGLINLLSGITPGAAARLARLDEWSPLTVQHGGQLTAVLSGFGLLLLAQRLWRNKRNAWLLTMIVLGISFVAHLVKGLDYAEAGLALALLIYLWTQRAHFQALSDPPSVRQGLEVLITGLLFTLVYGIVGFYVLDHHFGVTFTLDEAFTQTLVMFTQFYDPGIEPITSFGRYFAFSIYAVGAFTLGYALWMLLRPVLMRYPAGPGERHRAQTIVEAYGRSSLARFVLFPDKAYWFSPGGSVVGYALQGRTALALGDPIGPADDIAPAIDGFQSFCAHNDWLVAFYQTQPDHLDAYRAVGLESLCIGHEAIVRLNEFTLRGSTHKQLRNTVNRLTKLGYRAQMHEPPQAAAFLAELRSISDEWLMLMHGREQRFSLGWFDDAYVGGARVMAVHDPNDQIVAFVNLVPEYQAHEATIDLMRRRRQTENGVMDFLFVALFEWAQHQGYASFNLGLSALAGVGEQPDDPAVERALNFIYAHVNQLYNFKGLHTFKAKFDPHWSPRYLIFPGYATLPALGLAIEQVTTGRSFVLDYVREQTKREPLQAPTTSRATDEPAALPADVPVDPVSHGAPDDLGDPSAHAAPR
jgi:phosphatidylglycerol lysyltransferase